MDNLEIIRLVLAQHKVIVGQIESAKGSVSDMGDLLNLEGARSDMMLAFQQKLSDKLNDLGKKLSPLDKGLRRHYAFEEQYLPPLLGELLTEALVLEHKQLLIQMEETTSFISGVKTEGLTRIEELEKETLVYQRLDGLRRNKLDHLNREEAVLLTLQSVLETEKRGDK